LSESQGNQAAPISDGFVPSPNPAYRAWALDPLRVLEALMVLVQHCSTVGLSEVFNSQIATVILSYGYLDVDVFFFISGIITTLFRSECHGKEVHPRSICATGACLFGDLDHFHSR